MDDVVGILVVAQELVADFPGTFPQIRRAIEHGFPGGVGFDFVNNQHVGHVNSRMNGADQCTAKAERDSSRWKRRGHNKAVIGSAGFGWGGNGRARTAISVLLGERRVQGREYERTAERQTKEADRAYWAGLSPDSRRVFLRLSSSLELFREMGEGGEGLRLVLLPVRRRFIRRSSSLIPLVFIVVAVEAE